MFSLDGDGSGVGGGSELVSIKKISGCDCLNTCNIVHVEWVVRIDLVKHVQKKK